MTQNGADGVNKVKVRLVCIYGVLRMHLDKCSKAVEVTNGKNLRGIRHLPAFSGDTGQQSQPALTFDPYGGPHLLLPHWFQHCQQACLVAILRHGGPKMRRAISRSEHIMMVFAF